MRPVFEDSPLKEEKKDGAFNYVESRRDTPANSLLSPLVKQRVITVGMIVYTPVVP